MSVIRIQKARQHYVILDSTAPNDARLSFRAKGIHTYLMTKPHNWQVNVHQLEKQSPREARDAIRAALKELEDTGYVRRTRTRGSRGRMTGWDTTVYETPTLANLAAEDERLIGLEDDDSPITDCPKSDNTKSVSPKTDSPNSDIPLSVKPAENLDSSFPPKTDSPNSANPLLVSIKEETKEKRKDSLSSTSVDEVSPTPKVDELVDAWNDVCSKHGGLPRKKMLSDKLREKIRRRLKEHSEDEFWDTVLNKIVDSPFLSGKKRDWRASFDWLVENGENCIKVYEGAYDECQTEI